MEHEGSTVAYPKGKSKPTYLIYGPGHSLDEYDDCVNSAGDDKDRDYFALLMEPSLLKSDGGNGQTSHNPPQDDDTAEEEEGGSVPIPGGRSPSPSRAPSSWA